MAVDPKKVEAQLKQIQSLFDRLGKMNPYANLDPSKVSESVNEAKKLEIALDGVQSRVDNMDQSFGDLSKQLSATINEIKKGPSATDKFAKGFKGVLAEVKKLTYEEEGLDSLNLKQLQNLKKRAQQRHADTKDAATELVNESGLQGMINAKIDKRTKEYRSLTDAQKAAIGFLKDEDKTLQSINDKINERVKKEEETIKRMGSTGAALKGVEKVLGKIGLGDLASTMDIPQINEDLREFADTGASSQEIFQKGIELSGKAIKRALSDPLVQVAIAAKVIIGAIVKGVKALEEDTGTLAKNLNVSAGEARIMAGNFADAASSNDSLFVSSQGLAESSMEINDALGTSVNYTADQLKTFTELKKTAGLTAEEMMGIQALSLATGGNFEDIADSTLKQIENVKATTGVAINTKKVMTEISNVSEATQLSLGKSGPAIGAAVVTAKALGMELSKVDDIAGSLLNFESSIKDELAAELLIGKNINLEKARQAALNNDLETVATEIAKQAGSAAEFGEMNRIQQDALAKAVGMSREDLGKTLFIQEQLAGASGIEKENRAKMLENLTDQYGLEKAQEMLRKDGVSALMAQASSTEKMNAAFTKIDEFVKSIAMNFAPLVDMFAAVAGYIGESEELMSFLTGALGAFGIMLTIVAGKALILAGIEIAKMFAGIVGSFSMLGPVGTVAGIALAAGTAAAAYSYMKADDLEMAPSSPGYGDRILSTPKGSISLNNEDTIVAGTSLGQNKGSTDNSEGNKLLAQIAKGLQRQKPVPLYQITRS